MRTYPPHAWSEVPFGKLNQFTSKTVDPAGFPAETFELYSVPSFPSGKPEIVMGESIGSTKQLVEPDDVLVCKINPRINRVWQVKPAQQYRQIASSEWIGFRCTPLDARFFRYYFSSPEFRELICTDVTGVGGSLTRAQPKKVATFSVPVAPLAEQKRIADKLDAVLARVDACRNRLDRIPTILQRFRQSVLAVATSGALTEDWREDKAIDEEWQQLRLADIAEIQGGVTKDTKRQSLDDEEVPYLRVANVQRGYLDLREMKTIRVPESKLSGLLLKSGDILFNEGGDIDKLGRGWVWEGQIDRCSFQNHVFRARLFDQSNQPKYISWWGNFRGLDFFLRSGKQTTNLASINKSMLSNLPISLPSPEEQAEIVRRVEILFAFADRLEARHTTAQARVENLTPAILSKAFRGELAPQDPNDEPASKLLARIAAIRANSVPDRRACAAKKYKVPSTPKEITEMSKTRQDQDVKDMPYLADHLRRIGGTATAEALFMRAGLPITDFYKQLAWEVENGLLLDRQTVLELPDAA